MSTKTAILLSLTFSKRGKKGAKKVVLYNIMPILRVDSHSFTKNTSIFTGNDAGHFPKTWPCFPKIISIIFKSDAGKSSELVKIA
jgi:hypothetical protein